MGLILRIILGLFVLSLIMFFHEGGHFIAGKYLGFTIRSFNIFMGPTIWKHRGKDGILYTLKSLPIGASVEFSGELEDDSLGEEFVSTPETEEEMTERLAARDDPGSFFNRPRWARAIVAFNGPFMNFLTAFLALAILFSFTGVILPVVDQVPAELQGAAQRAGIEAGDRIVEINGEKIKTAYDISSATVFSKTPYFLIDVEKPNGEAAQYRVDPKVKDRGLIGFSYYVDQKDPYITVSEVNEDANGGNPVIEVNDRILKIGGIDLASREDWNAAITEAALEDKPIEIELIRDGKTLTVESQPEMGKETEPLGIYLVQSERFGDAMSQAYHTPMALIRMTFKGFGMLFSGRIKANEALAGPVRFVQIVGDVVKEPGTVSMKVERLVSLFAFLSVGIGFTQLIPIPPFDGHHLLILAIEGIRRKDLSVRTKQAIATFGFFLLIFLVFLTLYFDLSHVFGH